MNVEIWAVFLVAAAAIGTIMGVIYRRTVNNSNRIGSLEVSLGRIENIPHVVERHEEREDKQFESIGRKLEQINIRITKMALDVAVIKKNGISED